MPQVSTYERLQIRSLLGEGAVSVEPGLALHLMPDTLDGRYVFDFAVEPAMRKNGLNARGMAAAFDSDSSLAEVCGSLLRAEAITADLTGWTADLAYVLGVAHALGRCPVLLTRGVGKLPFNLAALRCIEYEAEGDGMHTLRENLTRSVRIFLSAARASESSGDVSEST